MWIFDFYTNLPRQNLLSLIRPTCRLQTTILASSPDHPRFCFDLRVLSQLPTKPGVPLHFDLFPPDLPSAAPFLESGYGNIELRVIFVLPYILCEGCVKYVDGVE
jgi:hypothetical protein